VERDYVVKAEP